MKTNIFLDFVPLLEMDNKQLESLATDIVNENKEKEDKENISRLLTAIQNLSLLIYSKI